MARTIGLDDADYPTVLKDLDDPPRVLCVRGVLPDLTGAVAIVGTRKVDALGMRFARELAEALARAGHVIVSGGAHGIDTAAHEGALDAGGLTIAVLPSPVEQPYPPRNQRLFARIAETGALINEQGVDEPRHPSTFLARNRVIAALAPITIVVQAPLRSGALSTAAHARRLGRRLMAVPFAPWDPRGQGCLVLLKAGAELCRGSHDVLTETAPTPTAEAAPSRQALEDPDQQAVHDALAAGPSSADGLCDATQLAAARVQRALLMLLLAGEIAEIGAGRYALDPRRAGP